MRSCVSRHTQAVVEIMSVAFALAVVVALGIITVGAVCSGVMLGKPHVAPYVSRMLAFVTLSAGALVGVVTVGPDGWAFTILCAWIVGATAAGRLFCPVGLTGGIASGKSRVSAALASRGAVIVDADLIARKVVEPGQPAYRDIVATFGDQVVLPGGGLDRKALGRVIFGDRAQRAKLNAITHGRIRRTMLWQILSNCLSGRLVLIDAPLLLDNAPILASFLCSCIVVVTAPEDIRLQRILARDGLSEADAKQRIAAQVSDTQRLRSAHHVVVNAGSEDHLTSEVDRLWHRLKMERSRWI